MLTKIGLIGLVAAIAGAIALGFVSQGNPTLGLVELEGGTKKIELSTSAVPPDGKIVGRIKNATETGRTIGDVTFEVVKKDGTTPPTSSGSTRVEHGDANTDAPNSPNSSGSGFKATVNFGDEGPSPMAPDGDPYDFEIDIATTGTGDLIEVRITPSDDPKPAGSAHADILSGYALTTQEPGGMHRLAAPAHAIGSAYVENAERGSSWDKVTALSGSCTLPAGISLQAVTLRDPSMAFASVAGTQVQLDGNSFQLTGFSALAPGEVYELRLEFSAVPEAGYLVSLLAEF